MRKVYAVLPLLALLVCCSAAYGGEPEKPAAPEPKPAHRFFDLENSLAMSSFAVTLAGDSLSTQKGLSRPGFKEMNPLARPFEQSRAGAAVYATGSFGLITAGMYLAHKTGHHRLERLVPFGLAAWEGFLTVRNYHVISRPR